VPGARLTRRTIALAVIGLLVLTVGGVAFVYALTQPGSSSASNLWWPPDAQTAAGAAATGAPGALAPSPAPDGGPQPVSPEMVTTGALPPAMPADRQARSDKLLELREQRRENAMDQLNAREAARRARLGLENK
jgi:hypothetical protein